MEVSLTYPTKSSCTTQLCEVFAFISRTISAFNFHFFTFMILVLTLLIFNPTDATTASKQSRFQDTYNKSQIYFSEIGKLPNMETDFLLNYLDATFQLSKLN